MPKPHRRNTDITNDLVKEITASRVKSALLSERKQVTLFLRQYFDNVAYEDLQGRAPKVMARAALSHLNLAKIKRKGKALVRIFNPTEKEHGYSSPYTIIEMINDDMPFLVDSVSAAINRQDLNIHITVHPVMRIFRDGKGRLKKVW